MTKNIVDFPERLMQPEIISFGSLIPWNTPFENFVKEMTIDVGFLPNFYTINFLRCKGEPLAVVSIIRYIPGVELLHRVAWLTSEESRVPSEEWKNASRVILETQTQGIFNRATMEVNEELLMNGFLPTSADGINLLAVELTGFYPGLTKEPIMP